MKQPPYIPLLHLLLGIAWLLVYAPACFAQQAVPSGKRLPRSGQEGEWFFVPAKGIIYRHDQTAWLPKLSNVKTAVRCHSFILATNQALLADHITSLLSLGGKLVDFSIQNYFCGDSILMVRGQRWFNIYDVQGNPMCFDTETGLNCQQASTGQMHLQGMVAYCVPAYFELDPLDKYSFDCSSLHNWGVLGENGRWLVAPQFDAPIRFRNGIAEVLYYGQKRKINEKGEFVE